MNMLKHLTRIIIAALAVTWIAGCDDSTVDKIKEALTNSGILDKVTIER